MASLIFVKNPLSPFDRETFELADGARPIDWLLEHYPPEAGGCGGAVIHLHNGRRIDVDDDDYLNLPVAPNDVVTLAVNPGLEAFLISLGVALIVAALSIAVQLLFFAKPKPPAFTAADNAEPSPVYSVRSSQNVARLGEPIPVPYGNVLHTPDIASQPYNFYLNGNQQYLDMLLCLGQGNFTVQQILVGDTDVNDIADAAVQVHIAPPSEHAQAIGNLGAVFAPGPTFRENVLTSAEVGEQEFFTTGDNFGWFRMGKSGQIGRYLQVDISWPRGLYRLDTSGTTWDTSVQFDVQLVQADANGNPIAGTEQSHSFTQFTLSGQNPLAVTYDVDAGSAAMWLVKIVRNTTQYPTGGEINTFTWAALKMNVVTTAGAPAYGNVTLLCVRFRATAVSSSANNQIRVRLQRNLPPLGSGAPVATNSPADAFVDILTNLDYGARRPLSEVDTTRLAALKSFWALGGHSYEFNGIYTGRTTIWEALTDTLQGVGAAPLPLGALMSAAQDGIKNVRTMMFSDQNIGQDSFRLSYSFDREGDNDGVEIEYRNPLTFAPAFARWPALSGDPDKVTLFGCTDARQAGEFARLMWQRRSGNRRTVTFETEMEGLIPILGERSAISHTLPRWGQSGRVVGVAGLTITLDRKLLWDDPILVPPYVISFRDELGGISNVVQCTRGPTDDVAILASDPWAGTGQTWSLALTQELTHFAFGDSTHSVKDFILTNLAPKDNKRVEVGGVYYDPAVYSGTFAFLAYPVP